MCFSYEMLLYVYFIISVVANMIYIMSYIIRIYVQIKIVFLSFLVHTNVNIISTSKTSKYSGENKEMNKEGEENEKNELQKKMTPSITSVADGMHQVCLCHLFSRERFFSLWTSHDCMSDHPLIELTPLAASSI